MLGTTSLRRQVLAGEAAGQTPAPPELPRRSLQQLQAPALCGHGVQVKWRLRLRPGTPPSRAPHLQLSLLGAGVEFKVLNADGGDDMSLPPGVAGAVGEDDLVVTLACP